MRACFTNLNCMSANNLLSGETTLPAVTGVLPAAAGVGGTVEGIFPNLKIYATCVNFGHVCEICQLEIRQKCQGSTRVGKTSHAEPVCSARA